MAKVAGVRFKAAGKVYYFDSGDLNLVEGDEVIVETSRGPEFGRITFGTTFIDDEKLMAPLKPVLRFASEDDKEKNRENQKEKEGALRVFKEKIEKHGLDMNPVDVEYTFDGSKVIFYFTSEGRVDFRELVRDLASVFRMRIELRQIGVRDEAKMLGGYGSCGRELCCHSWLPDFAPVSIKMAKAQNLSLNPLKISGICGRLMCCLQYEDDNYVKARKGMPGIGERITTPGGSAIVIDANILENKIKARLIVEEKEGGKPEKLSPEVYTYSKSEITRADKYKSREAAEEKKAHGKRAPQVDIELTGMSEDELEAELSE